MQSFLVEKDSIFRRVAFTFKNGAGLSVIWGRGSYSDNRNADDFDVPDHCVNAEVMLLIDGKCCFNPIGWVEPEHVAILLAMLASAPDKESAIKLWKEATKQTEE